MARLLERSRSRISYCAKALPPTSTPCSFRTLAAISGWNEVALLSAYRQGLDAGIRAQMAIYDDSVGLESFMEKATRISQRLSACHTAETAHPSVSPATGSPVPEPMQVDSSRLSDQERAR